MQRTLSIITITLLIGVIAGMFLHDAAKVTAQRPGDVGPPPGTQPLTSVAHDATLIGDGTAASPLGVAGGSGANQGSSAIFVTAFIQPNMKFYNNISTMGQSTTELGVPMPASGKVTALALYPFSNSTNAATAVTVRINKTSTILSTTIPAGSTSPIMVSGDVAFNAGDLFSVELDGSSATSGSVNLQCSFKYQLD